MKSPFFDQLARKVHALGGYHNAHLHLDRAYTMTDGTVAGASEQVQAGSHLSLQKKHALIRTVHEGPAYAPADIARRVSMALDHMIEVGTTRADTVVDVTADRVGTSALETIMELARARAGQISLRAAAYTPMGFDDSKPEQWRIFEQGVAQADFIGSLPEADDRRDYPDAIGYDEHCRRMLDLARSTGKMLQIHTDQVNCAVEDATERLLDVMERESLQLADASGGPLVWAVHMISPSMYDEARWHRLVERLVAFNVGVITCPSGAVGMRQLRAVQSPTYNSIARVLELVAAGVPVRMGCDNICDMLSPTTTADLTDEVYMLSAAVRYYDVDILAKLACGVALDAEDRAKVQTHLDKNDAEMAKILARLGIEG